MNLIPTSSVGISAGIPSVVAPNDLAALLADQIAAAHAHAGSQPLTVGLTGPQGSGKSTLAGFLPGALAQKGLRGVALGLDDLYLTKSERVKLAEEVHPLFATRGPPGTHDATLGLGILESLSSAGRTRIPRFDKARDDRVSHDGWTAVEGPIDIIIFEGWCVNARPQSDEALAVPINLLERDEDTGSVWRRHANAALAHGYQKLFARIGFQILLRPPDFETVFTWRLQQEHELHEASGVGQTDLEIARFVAHFERITRHIDREMPHRADVVVDFARTTSSEPGVRSALVHVRQ